MVILTACICFPFCFTLIIAPVHASPPSLYSPYFLLSNVHWLVDGTNMQRGGAPGSGGESYQQLLATEMEEGGETPPDSPALRGFRRQKRRVSRNIGGGVETLWRAVRTRMIFFACHTDFATRVKIAGKKTTLDCRRKLHSVLK